MGCQVGILLITIVASNPKLVGVVQVGYINGLKSATKVAKSSPAGPGGPRFGRMTPAIECRESEPGSPRDRLHP